MGELGDPVKAPAHYAGDGVITCKDALKSMLTNSKLSPIQGYWLGCLFKYVWRFEHKNGIQDLEKARECLDMLIQEVMKDGYMV